LFGINECTFWDLNPVYAQALLALTGAKAAKLIPSCQECKDGGEEARNAWDEAKKWIPSSAVDCACESQFDCSNPPPPPPTHGSLSVVSPSPGKTILVSSDSDGVVRQTTYDPTQAPIPDWTAWASPANQPFKAGAATATISTSSGESEIFTIGDDGGVYTTYFDPAHGNRWMDWFGVQTQSFLARSIAATSAVPGGTSLFAVGNDGTVWSTYYDPRSKTPQWASWFSLGPLSLLGVDGYRRVAAQQAVSAVSPLPGGVAAFTVAGGTVMFDVYDPNSGTYSKWNPVKNQIAVPSGKTRWVAAPALAAVSPTPGGLMVFTVSTDGLVLGSYEDPRKQNAPPCLTPPCAPASPDWFAWSDWFGPQAQPFVATPSIAAISTVPGGTQLFTVGEDGVVWSSYYDPRVANPRWSDWFGPQAQPFKATSILSVVSAVPGGAQVFVVDTDGKVWSTYYDPRVASPAWSQWFSLL
jgi:hypothetical protein